MAPWLEDRVMASVRVDVASRGALRWYGPRTRLVIAALALAIAVLAVTVLVGTRLAGHPTSTPAGKPSPSRDAAVVRYRALIQRDMHPIYNGGSTCVTRLQCIAGESGLKTATESLLHDVESTPTPSSLVPAAAQLKTAAQQYIQALDAAINAMQDPNSNYIAIGFPSSNNLDLADMTIECWPVVPFERSDRIEGYGCTAQ
jgi:hypothetical protein